jgi:hypothetical protein
MAEAFVGHGQSEDDGRAEADLRLSADLPAVGFEQKKEDGRRQENQIEHCYHTPSLRPHHQTRPSVAVFCSFFNTPGRSVRKNGRLE